MLEQQLKRNQELIAQLNGKVKNGEKYYFQFMSAINALDINNDLMDTLILTMEGEAPKGECIMRLYSMLESLFASVDALYSVNLIITGKKDYLNINQNRQVRELKYIKNDVVGHPSSRIYDDYRTGCCVIKKDLITLKSFKYYIYANKEIKAREIKILDLIEAYYDEANKALERILSFVPTPNDDIIAQVKKIYKKLNSDLEIQEDVLELRGLYFNKYPNMSKKDVRFVWRIELLLKLRKAFTGDKDLTEVYEYCSGYQLAKIYNLVKSSNSSDKDNVDNNKKIPKGLVQFYKLLDKIPGIVGCSKYLDDMTHPLFQSSLKKCMEITLENDTQAANKYLEYIKNAADINDQDMVYCLGVLLNNKTK